MGKKDKDKKKKKKDKKEKKRKKGSSLIEEQVAADEPGESETAAILDHIQPSFIEDGARSIRAADLAEVVRAKEELLRRFAVDQPLGRLREEATLMFRLVEDYRAGRYVDVSYWSIAVMVFGFHYVLKPIDIIPDSLPVIGQLDDTMVLVHCLEMVKKDLETYKVRSLAPEGG
jgi:uncharacterized membrane protein YkvA (DUF1232 family)